MVVDTLDAHPATTLAEAAHMYAQHGVHIFPVTPHGKLPLLPRCTKQEDAHQPADCGGGHGHGLYDATTDPATIKRWWTDHPDANIGVALGANGLFALDVDGPEGRAHLDELEQAYDRLPDTYQVITGRPEGFGRHHIYRQPATGPQVRNRDLAPKLETRGTGGYVIAPPSIHPSGRVYLAEGSWGQIADPPAWLVALATRERTTPPPPAGPQLPPGDDPVAEKRLKGLAGHLALMDADTGRNNALNHAAHTCGRLIAADRLDRAHVEHTLTTAAQRCGLDRDPDCGPRGITATIRSGIEAGLTDPDHDTPLHVPTPGVVQPPTDTPAAPIPTSVLTQTALGKVQDGAAFILDTDHQLDPVWGRDSEVAWASGEPLILTGPTGVGKTTLAHQLLERLLGITDEPLLDMPVTTRSRKVLYLACDRPTQIRRAFARRMNETHRDVLTDRLAVHNGYLPVMVDQHPRILVELVEATGADVVVIDSLKDIATELEKGPNAIAINQALQMVCQTGAEVIVLHHQRKAQGDNKRPKAIDDLYGNTLIPSGAGSVLLLWGAPGDLAVELHHLKTPADEVGPLKLVHDHRVGRTAIDDSTRIDLAAIAARSAGGLTVPIAAQHLYGTSTTGESQKARSEREKARRALHRLVDKGVLLKVEQGKGTTAIYRARNAPTELET